MSANALLRTPCPDCGVAIGDRHEPGCDVARCVGCGAQTLSHHAFGDAECEVTAWPMQTWTGEWPGEAECREWGISGPTALDNLNHLIRSGIAHWSSEQERYVRPEVHDPAAQLLAMQTAIGAQLVWWERVVRDEERMGPRYGEVVNSRLVEAQSVVRTLRTCLNAAAPARVAEPAS